MNEQRQDSYQRTALEKILEERDYQNKRWGRAHDKCHSPEDWSVILGVYMGKVHSQVFPYQIHRKDSEFLKRVRQLGALCLAILETNETSRTDTE